VVSSAFRKCECVAFVTDPLINGISKDFFIIIAAFAEFERDRIAERISDVKANEREKGRNLGGQCPTVMIWLMVSFP